MSEGKPCVWLDCQACSQYEATTEIEFLKLHVKLCHSCLVAVRAVAKTEFKRSEAERPRAHRHPK